MVRQRSDRAWCHIPCSLPKAHDGVHPTASATRSVPAASSKSEIAQGRVIVGTATKRPVVSPVALRDGNIVDAGDAQAHQAVFVEFPILVATAKPIAAIVVPFIGETNRRRFSRKVTGDLMTFKM
jgi:hypothetical protein